MQHKESKLQITCVKYFRLKYPKLLLFSVPNGGRRGVIEASIMKSEGVTAGVADLCLLYPSNGFHALFIEMKIDKGKQSLSQIQFELYCIDKNYKYVICRSLDDFIKAVTEYLF